MKYIHTTYNDDIIINLDKIVKIKKYTDVAYKKFHIIFISDDTISEWRFSTEKIRDDILDKIKDQAQVTNLDNTKKL